MPHTICWFDLPVVDFERAVKFYSRVLATELKKEWPEMEVAVFPHGNGDVAGCLYKDLRQPYLVSDYQHEV